MTWISKTILAAGIVLSQPLAHAATVLFQPSEYQVQDAITLSLNGEIVHLSNISAPELGQMCMINGKQRDCGVIARSQLLDLTAATALKCTIDGTKTAYCLAGGFDISEQMVYTGWAVPLPGAPDRYRAKLQDAQKNKRGFWRAEFLKPWAALAR